ncbi:MAG: hypothetical protein ACU84J_03150 [Gammaproteobacteria bacterium]
MTNELIELFVIMFIIATTAFAPLGYFIYKFNQKRVKPFGETEPHGDSPSRVNDFAEAVIALFKKIVNKK